MAGFYPDPNALYNQAIQLHQNGMFDQAATLYRQILMQDPFNVNAHMALVDTNLRSGKPKDAYSHAKKVTELMLDNADAYFNLGTVCLYLEKQEEALESFQKAVSLNPKHPQAQYNLGTLQYQMGDKAAAVKALRAAIKAQRDFIPAYLNLGELYSEEGNYSKAEELYKIALKLNPNYGPTLKSMGMVCHVTTRIKEAQQYFEKAHKAIPEDASVMVLLGNVHRDQENEQEAEAWYRKALEQDPANPVAQQNLSLLEGNTIYSWHVEMLGDTARNEAYNNALAKAVQPGMTVLDIGTGSGLLAMMAARAGAKSVVACEMVSILADSAKEIVAQNGFLGQISIHQKKSTILKIGEELPEKADLLVSEILDIGLLGEGVLPTVRHARNSLLKPDAVILPSAATVYGVLIESEHAAAIHPIREISGFDLSAFDKFRKAQAYKQVKLPTIPHRQLSGAFQAWEVDFYQLPTPAGLDKPHKHVLEVEITEPGTVHGIVFWFDLWVDKDICLSTGPHGEMIHWGQALTVFDEAKTVEAGDKVKVRLNQSDTVLQFKLG